MTEVEVIKHEVAKAMTRAYPPVIMSLEDVADLLGYSYNFVRNELQHQADFPAKLERFKHPRWSRDAIMEWAKVSVQ